MTWVTGEVPPFLWRGSAGPQGYAYELFQLVIKRGGMAADLQIYPWARALRLMQQGQAQVCLIAARTPAREAQFAWLFPVGSFRFALLTRRGQPALAWDPAVLRDRRIAVLRGSSSREWLDEVGLPVAAEGRDYAELVALLRRGVVDAILGPEAVVRAQLGQLGLPQDSVQAVALPRRQDLYAVSLPSLPEAQQRLIADAYRSLLDDGSVTRLKRRHASAFADD